MRALILVAWVVVVAQWTWVPSAGAQGSVAAVPATTTAPSTEPPAVDVLDARAAALCAKASCT